MPKRKKYLHKIAKQSRTSILSDDKVVVIKFGRVKNSKVTVKR